MRTWSVGGGGGDTGKGNGTPKSVWGGQGGAVSEERLELTPD